MESPFQTNWFKFQNKLSVCEFGKGNEQEEKVFFNGENREEKVSEIIA